MTSPVTDESEMSCVPVICIAESVAAVKPVLPSSLEETM